MNAMLNNLRLSHQKNSGKNNPHLMVSSDLMKKMSLVVMGDSPLSFTTVNDHFSSE